MRRSNALKRMPGRRIAAAVAGMSLATVTALAAAGAPAPAGVTSSPEDRLAGVVLVKGGRRVRVVDNAGRFCALGDNILPGQNGLASLIDEGRQGRNIFMPGGLNYECGSTESRMGRRADLWNAPRVAPMAIERLDAHRVRLAQKAGERRTARVRLVYRPYPGHRSAAGGGQAVSGPGRQVRGEPRESMARFDPRPATRGRSPI